MQASWCEGQMLAHWWVELCLGPLVSRAVSRGMSKGSWGLRKSLWFLSADGWNFVPALLVVWPEMSQTGNYRLSGEARIWWPKLASRRSHTDWNSLIFLPPVSLCLERATVVPHLLRRPSKASRQFWPGFSEVNALALGPSAYETLCGPTKNGVSVLSSSVELLQSSPAGLQS